MRNKLILIGYRATGKTTLAEAISNQLGWNWLDTDQLIEKRAGKTIAQIFAENGELFFRDLEEEVVADVLRETQPLVIATGGGVPMRETSRKRLHESGVVFWLQAKPEVIYLRMNQDKTTADRRPALTQLAPIKEIESVLENRKMAYRECAHCEIDTNQDSTVLLTNTICQQYEEFNFGD